MGGKTAYHYGRVQINNKTSSSQTFTISGVGNPTINTANHNTSLAGGAGGAGGVGAGYNQSAGSGGSASDGGGMVVLAAVLAQVALLAQIALAETERLLVLVEIILAVFLS